MPYRPEGSLSAKWAIVAEAPAAEEMRQGRPLVGMSGKLHDELMSQAGIPRRQTYITNVLDHMMESGEKKYKPYITIRGELTELGLEHASRLKKEMENFSGNVIIPMGNLSLLALTGKHGITKWRGSILPSTLLNGKKCIPTIHPAATFKGGPTQYLWRYLIRYDLKRARKEADFPEIQDLGYAFYVDPSYEECLAYLDECSRSKVVSIDIEISGRSISRICFALSHTSAISIPLISSGGGPTRSCWTEIEEVIILLAIARVLGDPNIAKIGQNLIFDITIIFTELGIITRGEILDTMVAHHIMYPDFLKRLALLCSLYTDQPYYKDMVKHGEFGKEEG